jgi:hypothetical protein
MTEFCEGCPMRGLCTEEIETVEFKTYGGGIYNRGTNMAVVLDAHHNRSEPFYKESQSVESVLRRIDDCDGVIERERTRLFRKPETVVKCQALGELGLIGHDDTIYRTGPR